MKRKWLAALFAATCAVACAAAVTACNTDGGQHTEHSFGEGWGHDENVHYHECTHEGCNAKEESSIEVHKWDDGTPQGAISCVQSAVVEYKCTVCGETRQVTEYGEHDYSKTLTIGTDGHWYACQTAGCDAKKGEQAHDWKLKTQTVAPTCYQAGEGEYECDCGATKTDEIAATGNHSFALTLSHNAEKHWYACQTAGCDAKNGVAGHDWVAGTPVLVGDTEKRLEAVSTCSCGESKTEEVEISAVTLGETVSFSLAHGERWFKLSVDNTRKLTLGLVKSVSFPIDFDIFAEADLENAVISGFISYTYEFPAGVYYIRVKSQRSQTADIAMLVREYSEETDISKSPAAPKPVENGDTVTLERADGTRYYVFTASEKGNLTITVNGLVRGMYSDSDYKTGVGNGVLLNAGESVWMIFYVNGSDEQGNVTFGFEAAKQIVAYKATFLLPDGSPAAGMDFVVERGGTQIKTVTTGSDGAVSFTDYAANYTVTYVSTVESIYSSYNSVSFRLSDIAEDATEDGKTWTMTKKSYVFNVTVKYETAAAACVKVTVASDAACSEILGVAYTNDGGVAAVYGEKRPATGNYVYAFFSEYSEDYRYSSNYLRKAVTSSATMTVGTATMTGKADYAFTLKYDDTPAANVTVKLIENGSEADSKVTDGEGKVTFRAFKGAYTVLLQDYDGAYSYVEEIRTTQTQFDYEIVLLGARNYTVVVSKFDGTKLGGVTLQLKNGSEVIATANTDADGVATFENAAAGNYTVAISNGLPEGVVATTLSVLAATTEYRLVLYPANAVTGKGDSKSSSVSITTYFAKVESGETLAVNADGLEHGAFRFVPSESGANTFEISLEGVGGADDCYFEFIYLADIGDTTVMPSNNAKKIVADGAENASYSGNAAYTLTKNADGKITAITVSMNFMSASMTNTLCVKVHCGAKGCCYLNAVKQSPAE